MKPQPTRHVGESIMEVLMEHSRRIDPNHPGYSNCRCGFSVDIPQDHAAHVTGEILAVIEGQGRE